jgi:hypothetical protein
VLCVSGRGSLDEAAAITLAQLLEKHGLRARVEGADAVATPNIFRLETTGVVMVCLSYLDVISPAHMRYAIRRMRRRSQAQIVLGCWMAEVNAETLRDTAKADLVATTLRDAVKLCLEAARNSQRSDTNIDAPKQAVIAIESAAPPMMRLGAQVGDQGGVVRTPRSATKDADVRRRLAGVEPGSR